MYKGIIILTVIAASSAQYLRNECPSDSSALLLPHLTDCSKYYKCSNGDKIETNCPTGALFDSDLQGCSLAIFVTCAPGATAPVSDELLSFAIDCSDFAVKMLLPHDSDCERYYKCDNGKKLDMFCSPGAAFDFMAQDCHEGVTCTTTSIATTTTTETITTETTTTEPSTTTTATTTTTTTAAPTTKSSPSAYLLPHEGDCSKYYKCVKGEKVAMECSPGTAFDFNTQACSIGATCTLLAANEPPATEPEATTTSTITTTPVITTMEAATTTTISTTVTDEPTTVFLSTIEITTGFLRIQAGLEFLPNGCPVEPETEPPPVNNMIFIDYYLPHDSQCSKYYRCVGGNKVEKDCSPGTWFDVNSQACKNPATVNCANQAEVPRSTTEATTSEITTTETPTKTTTETSTTETSTTTTTETSTTETLTTSAELTTTEYLTTDIPTTIIVTTDNITVYNEIPTENIFTTVIITAGLSLNEYLRAHNVQYLPNGCPIRPRIKGRPGRPRVVKKVPGRPKIKKPATKPTILFAESTMQDITISEYDITTTPHEFFSAEECNDGDCNNVEETSPKDDILTTNVEESESGADDLVESNPEVSDSETWETGQENSPEKVYEETAITVSVNEQETVDSSIKVEETYTVAADLPEMSLPVQGEFEQTVPANDQVVEEDSVTEEMVKEPNIMPVNLPLEEILEEFSDQVTKERLAITTVASPEEEAEETSLDETEPEDDIKAGSESETKAAEEIIVLGVVTSTTLFDGIETLFETAGLTEDHKEEASVSSEKFAPEADENMEAATPLEESSETLPVTDETAEEGSVIEEVNEVEETELQENKVPVVENPETISESGVVDRPISAEEPSVLPVNLLVDVVEDQETEKQETDNLETVIEESESETADLFVESISEIVEVSDNTEDILGEESLEILPVTDHTAETESGTESVDAVTDSITEPVEKSLVEVVEIVPEDDNEAESADVEPIVLPVNLSPEEVAEDVKEIVSEKEPTIEEESETEADLLVESIIKAKETVADQTTESLESVSEPVNDEDLQESNIEVAKLPVETIPEATEKSLTEASTEEQLVPEPIEAQQGEETQVPDEVQALISKTTNAILPDAETITTSEIDVNAEKQAVDENPTAVTETDEMKTEETQNKAVEDISEATEMALDEETAAPESNSEASEELMVKDIEKLPESDHQSTTEGSAIQTASELSEDISETTEISLIEQTKTKEEEPGIVPVNLPLEVVADETTQAVPESYEISIEDVGTAASDLLNEPLSVTTEISLGDETLKPQSMPEPIEESLGEEMVETLSVIDQSTVKEFNDVTEVILETTEALLVDSEFVPEKVSITKIDELAVEPAIESINIPLEEALDETTELESESDKISVEEGTPTVFPMEDETKQPEPVLEPTEESLGEDITEILSESDHSTAETEEIGDAAEMITDTIEASQLDDTETLGYTLLTTEIADVVDKTTTAMSESDYVAAEDTKNNAVSLLTESVPESTETSLGEETVLSVSVSEPSEDSLDDEFKEILAQNDQSVTATEGLETNAADEMSEAIFETTVTSLNEVTETVQDTDTSQELGIVSVNVPLEEEADETTETITESGQILTESSESYLLGEPISEAGESATEQSGIAPLEEIADETTIATSDNDIVSTEDSGIEVTDSISEPISATTETVLEEDNIQSELVTEHTLVELQTDGGITETMSEEVQSESTSQAADEVSEDITETTAAMLENTETISEMPEISVTEFDGTTEEPRFVAVNLPLEEAVDESTLAELSGTEVDLLTESEPTSASTDTNYEEENKQQDISESTKISIQETNTDELLEGDQSTTEKAMQVLEDISNNSALQLNENIEAISETETEGIIEQIDLVADQGMDETTTIVPEVNQETDQETDQESDQINTADGETEETFVAVNLPLQELIDETASEMFETEQVSLEGASVVTTDLAVTNTALDEENEQEDFTEKSDEEITEVLLVESEQSTTEGSDSGIFEDDNVSTTILETEISDSQTELISKATETAVGGETEQPQYTEKADEELTTESLFESDQFTGEGLETQADISETTETLLNKNTETVAVATSDTHISSSTDEPGFVAANLPLEDMSDENALAVSEGDQVTTEVIAITTEALSEATVTNLEEETEQSESTEKSEEEVSTDSLLGSDQTTVEKSETQAGISESDIVSTDMFETEGTDLTTERSKSDATVTILGDKIEQTESTDKSDDDAEGSKPHADGEFTENDNVAIDMSVTDGSSSITESISGATETNFEEETNELELTEATTDSLLESVQTTILSLETQADAEESEGDYVPSEILETEDTNLTTESIADTVVITLGEETKQTESTKKPDEEVTTDSLLESVQTTVEGSETNADSEISEGVSIENSEKEGSSLITESIADAETTFRQATEESESTVKSDKGETTAESPETQVDSEMSDDISSTTEAMFTENTEAVTETDFDTEISGSTDKPGFVAVNLPLEDIVLENTEAVSDGDQVSIETNESLSEATNTALGDETSQSESTQKSNEEETTDSFFENDQSSAEVSETPVDAELSVGDISTETLETIASDLTTEAISGAMDNTLGEETEQTESTEKLDGEITTDSIFESDETTTESSETQAEGFTSEGDNILTDIFDTESSTLGSIAETTETFLKEVTEQTVSTERSDEDKTTGLLLESDQTTDVSSETQADNEMSDVADTAESFLNDIAETELETASDTTNSDSTHEPGFVAVNLPLDDMTDDITVSVLDSDQASTNIIGTEATDSTTAALSEEVDTSLGEDTKQFGDEGTTDSLLESKESMTEGSKTQADSEISGDIAETTEALLNEVTGTDDEIAFNTEIIGAPDELAFVAVNLPIEDLEDETTEAVLELEKASTVTLETQETDSTTLGGGNEKSESEKMSVETTTDSTHESYQTTSHDSEIGADIVSTEMLETEASESTIEPISLTTISEVIEQPVPSENSDEDVTTNSVVETGERITESLEPQLDTETSGIMETEGLESTTELITEAADTDLDEEAEQTESTDKSEEEMTTDSATEASETHTDSNNISTEIVEIKQSESTKALISETTNTVLFEETEHTEAADVEVTIDTIFESDQITDEPGFVPVNLPIEDIADEITVAVSDGDQGSTETLNMEATVPTIEPLSEVTNTTLRGDTEQSQSTEQSDEDVTTDSSFESDQTTTEKSETQAEEEISESDNVPTEMLGTEASESITASISDTTNTALEEETKQTESSGTPIEEVTTDALLESDEITAEGSETKIDSNLVSTEIMDTVTLETTSEPISWATFTTLREEQTESTESSDEQRPTDSLLNGSTDNPGFVAVNLPLEDLIDELTSKVSASDLVSSETLGIVDTDSMTEPFSQATNIGLTEDTKKSEPTQQSDEDVTTDSLLESDQRTTKNSKTQSDEETSESDNVSSEISETEASESTTALLSQTTNIDLGEETEHTEFTENLYEEVTSDSFLESDQTMAEGSETQTDGDNVSTEIMEMEPSESTTQIMSEATNTVLQEQTEQSSSEKSNEELTTDSLLSDTNDKPGFVAVNLPLEDLLNKTASTVSDSDQGSIETLGMEVIDSTNDLSMVTDVALGDGTEQLELIKQSDEEVTTELLLESDETTTDSSATQADEETSGSENVSTDMLGTEAFESTTHLVSETMNTVLEEKTEQTESPENSEEEVTTDLFLENDQSTAEDSETQADEEISGSDNISTGMSETETSESTTALLWETSNIALGEETEETESTESPEKEVTTDSVLESDQTTEGGTITQTDGDNVSTEIMEMEPSESTTQIMSEATNTVLQEQTEQSSSEKSNEELTTDSLLSDTNDKPGFVAVNLPLEDLLNETASTVSDSDQDSIETLGMEVIDSTIDLSMVTDVALGDGTEQLELIKQSDEEVTTELLLESDETTTDSSATQADEETSGSENVSTDMLGTEALESTTHLVSETMNTVLEEKTEQTESPENSEEEVTTDLFLENDQSTAEDSETQADGDNFSAEIMKTNASKTTLGQILGPTDTTFGEETKQTGSTENLDDQVTTDSLLNGSTDEPGFAVVNLPLEDITDESSEATSDGEKVSTETVGTESTDSTAGHLSESTVTTLGDGTEQSKSTAQSDEEATTDLFLENYQKTAEDSETQADGDNVSTKIMESNASETTLEPISGVTDTILGNETEQTGSKENLDEQITTDSLLNGSTDEPGFAVVNLPLEDITDESSEATSDGEKVSTETVGTESTDSTAELLLETTDTTLGDGTEQSKSTEQSDEEATPDLLLESDQTTTARSETQADEEISGSDNISTGMSETETSESTTALLWETSNIALGEETEETESTESPEKEVTTDSFLESDQTTEGGTITQADVDNVSTEIIEMEASESTTDLTTDALPSGSSDKLGFIAVNLPLEDLVDETASTALDCPINQVSTDTIGIESTDSMTEHISVVTDVALADETEQSDSTETATINSLTEDDQSTADDSETLVDGETSEGGSASTEKVATDSNAEQILEFTDTNMGYSEKYDEDVATDSMLESDQTTVVDSETQPAVETSEGDGVSTEILESEVTASTMESISEAAVTTLGVSDQTFVEILEPQVGSETSIDITKTTDALLKEITETDLESVSDAKISDATDEPGFVPVNLPLEDIEYETLVTVSDGEQVSTEISGTQETGSTTESILEVTDTTSESEITTDLFLESNQTTAEASETQGYDETPQSDNILTEMMVTEALNSTTKSLSGATDTTLVLETEQLEYTVKSDDEVTTDSLEGDQTTAEGSKTQSEREILGEVSKTTQALVNESTETEVVTISDAEISDSTNEPGFVAVNLPLNMIDEITVSVSDGDLVSTETEATDSTIEPLYVDTDTILLDETDHSQSTEKTIEEVTTALLFESDKSTTEDLETDVETSESQFFSKIMSETDGSVSTTGLISDGTNAVLGEETEQTKTIEKIDVEVTKDSPLESDQTTEKDSETEAAGETSESDGVSTEIMTFEASDSTIELFSEATDTTLGESDQTIVDTFHIDNGSTEKMKSETTDSTTELLLEALDTFLGEETELPTSIEKIDEGLTADLLLESDETTAEGSETQTNSEISGDISETTEALINEITETEKALSDAEISGSSDEPGFLAVNLPLEDITDEITDLTNEPLSDATDIASGEATKQFESTDKLDEEITTGLTIESNQSTVEGLETHSDGVTSAGMLETTEVLMNENTETVPEIISDSEGSDATDKPDFVAVNLSQEETADESTATFGIETIYSMTESIAQTMETSLDETTEQPVSAENIDDEVTTDSLIESELSTIKGAETQAESETATTGDISETTEDFLNETEENTVSEVEISMPTGELEIVADNLPFDGATDETISEVSEDDQVSTIESGAEASDLDIESLSDSSDTVLGEETEKSLEDITTDSLLVSEQSVEGTETLTADEVETTEAETVSVTEIIGSTVEPDFIASNLLPEEDGDKITLTISEDNQISTKGLETEAFNLVTETLPEGTDSAFGENTDQRDIMTESSEEATIVVDMAQEEVSENNQMTSEVTGSEAVDSIIESVATDTILGEETVLQETVSELTEGSLGEESTETNSENEQSAAEVPTCPGGYVGNMPHPDSCNFFYKCDGGEESQLTPCDDDFEFNSEAEECLPIADGGCTLSMTTTAGTTTELISHSTDFTLQSAVKVTESEAIADEIEPVLVTEATVLGSQTETVVNETLQTETVANADVVKTEGTAEEQELTEVIQEAPASETVQTGESEKETTSLSMPFVPVNLPIEMIMEGAPDISGEVATESETVQGIEDATITEAITEGVDIVEGDEDLDAIVTDSTDTDNCDVEGDCTTSSVNAEEPEAEASTDEVIDFMIEENIATEVAVNEEIQAGAGMTGFISETSTEETPESFSEITSVLVEENVSKELADVAEELASDPSTELTTESVPESTDINIAENIATELAVIQEIEADNVVTELASEASTEQAPESVSESTDVMIEKNIATELAIILEIQADDVVTELTSESDTDLAPESVSEATDVMIEENVATELAVVQAIQADDVVTELASEASTEKAPESVSESTDVMIEENIATELAVIQEIEADDVVTELTSESDTDLAPESVSEATDVMIEENVATELAVVQAIQADDVVTELASEASTEKAPESVSESTDVMIEENIATELAVIQEIQADDVVTELALKISTEQAPESVPESTDVMIDENIATELDIVQEIQADDVVTKLTSETATEQALGSDSESIDVMILENVATELAVIQENQADTSSQMTELAYEINTEQALGSVPENTDVMKEENIATELAIIQEIAADDVVTELTSESDTELAPESVSEATDVMIEENVATELAVVQEIQADDVVTELASEASTEQALESVSESTGVMKEENIATELAVIQEIEADDVVTQLTSELNTDLAPESVSEATDVMIEENVATELAVVQEIQADDVVTELASEASTEQALESVSESTDVMKEENIATELAVIQEIEADDVVTELASEIYTDQAPESISEVTDVMIEENVATELAIIQEIEADDVVTELASEANTDLAPESVSEATDVMIEENVATELAVVQEIQADNVVTELASEASTEQALESVSESTDVMKEENVATELAIIQEIEADDVVTELASEANTDLAPESVSEATDVMIEENVATELAVVQENQADDVVAELVSEIYTEQAPESISEVTDVLIEENVATELAIIQEIEADDVVTELASEADTELAPESISEVTHVMKEENVATELAIIQEIEADDVVTELASEADTDLAPESVFEATDVMIEENVATELAVVQEIQADDVVTELNSETAPEQALGSDSESTDVMIEGNVATEFAVFQEIQANDVMTELASETDTDRVLESVSKVTKILAEENVATELAVIQQIEADDVVTEVASETNTEQALGSVSESTDVMIEENIATELAVISEIEADDVVTELTSESDTDLAPESVFEATDVMIEENVATELAVVQEIQADDVVTELASEASTEQALGSDSESTDVMIEANVAPELAVIQEIQADDVMTELASETDTDQVPETVSKVTKILVEENIATELAEIQEIQVNDVVTEIASEAPDIIYQEIPTDNDETGTNVLVPVKESEDTLTELPSELPVEKESIIETIPEASQGVVDSVMGGGNYGDIASDSPESVSEAGESEQVTESTSKGSEDKGIDSAISEPGIVLVMADLYDNQPVEPISDIATTMRTTLDSTVLLEESNVSTDSPPELIPEEAIKIEDGSKITEINEAVTDSNDEDEGEMADLSEELTTERTTTKKRVSGQKVRRKTTSTTTTVAPTETTTEPPICPDGYVGNMPHPDLCNYYYQCDGAEEPIMTSCDDGFEFDDNTKECIVSEGGCIPENMTSTETIQTTGFITPIAAAETEATLNEAPVTKACNDADGCNVDQIIETNTEVSETEATEIQTVHTTAITEATIAEITTVSTKIKKKPTKFVAKIRRKTTTTTTTPPPTTTTHPVCPYGYDGKMADPDICNYYHKCDGFGNQVMLACDDGFEFDSTTHECVPTVIGGSCLPDIPPTIPAPTTQTPKRKKSGKKRVQPKTTSLKPTTTRRPICPIGYVGNVGHAGLCNYFFKCDGSGNPNLTPCADGYEFSLRKRDCVLISETGDCLPEDIPAPDPSKQTNETNADVPELVYSGLKIRRKPKSTTTTTTEPTTTEPTTTEPTTEELTTTEESLCPAGFVGNIAHPELCSFFYMCDGTGVPVLTPCEEELEFDPEQEICVPISEEGCSSGTKSIEGEELNTTPSTKQTTESSTTQPPTTEPTTTVPTSTEELTTLAPKCEPGFTGNIAHSKKCNQFFICTSGEPLVMFCSTGEEFDPVMKICVEIRSGGCTFKKSSDSTETSPTTEITSSINENLYTEEPSRRTSNEFRRKMAFSCLVGMFDNVPDPGQCNAFFMCSDRMVLHLYCPRGYEFDPYTKVCVSISEFGCSARSSLLRSLAEQVSPYQLNRRA